MRCIFDWSSNKLQTLSISLVALTHRHIEVAATLSRDGTCIPATVTHLHIIPDCLFFSDSFDSTQLRVPINSFHRHHHPHRHRLAMRNSHSYHI